MRGPSGELWDQEMLLRHLPGAVLALTEYLGLRLRPRGFGPQVERYAEVTGGGSGRPGSLALRRY